MVLVLLTAKLGSYRHEEGSISWLAFAYKAAHTTGYFWLFSDTMLMNGEFWCVVFTAYCTMKLLSLDSCNNNIVCIGGLLRRRGGKQLPKFPWTSLGLNIAIMMWNCVIQLKKENSFHAVCGNEKRDPEMLSKGTKWHALASFVSTWWICV